MLNWTLTLLDGTVEASYAMRPEYIRQSAAKRPDIMTETQSQQKLFNILATVLIISMVAVSTVGVGTIGMLWSVKTVMGQLDDKLTVTLPTMVTTQIDGVTTKIAEMTAMIDSNFPIIAHNSDRVADLEVRATAIEESFQQHAEDQATVMGAIDKLTKIAEGTADHVEDIPIEER